MKKKKLLIVAVIVLSNIHTIVYSQKINWGQAFIADKNYSPIVIAEEENAFYTSSCSDKELVLEKIDKKKSSVAYSKKYEIPKNQEIELIAVFFFLIMIAKRKRPSCIVMCILHLMERLRNLTIPSHLLKLKRMGIIKTMIIHYTNRLIIKKFYL
jgi:hypothetical protein